MHKILDPDKKYLESFCSLRSNLKVTVGLLVYNFKIESMCKSVCVCVYVRICVYTHTGTHVFAYKCILNTGAGC